MEKRYRVTLLEEKRQELEAMVRAGKAAARNWCVPVSSCWRIRQKAVQARKTRRLPTPWAVGE